VADKGGITDGQAAKRARRARLNVPYAVDDKVTAAVRADTRIRRRPSSPIFAVCVPSVTLSAKPEFTAVQQQVRFTSISRHSGVEMPCS
jgi:hypothetical protein